MSDFTLIHKENGEKYLREVSTAHYALLNNDKATQPLYEELNVLSEELNIYRDSFITEDGVMGDLTEEEQAVLDEKQNLFDSKFEEIKNTPSIVTNVIKGKSEIEYQAAKNETIEQEIKDLEDSRVGKTLEEVTAIEADIQVKLEDLHALPPDEIDNTVYWEGYYGKGGLCKRCSYNTHEGEHKLGGTAFRKNYPAVGYTYDPVRDAFYAPQPFESWTLNEDKCTWEWPVDPPPEDEENPIPYYWKEDTQEWVDYKYFSEPYSVDPPYSSWNWNTETGIYEPPVEKPEGTWDWDEETLNWITE